MNEKILHEIALSRLTVEQINQLTGIGWKDAMVHAKLIAIKQTAIDYVKEGKISFLFYVRCFNTEDGTPYYKNPTKIQNLINRSRKRWKN